MKDKSIEHKQMTQVHLYTTNSEREKYKSLATLYGIVIALDYLERA
jgi:ESCRT-I complex subunit VPS28